MGGSWKARARAVLGEFSVSFDSWDEPRSDWLVAVTNWSGNKHVDHTGYSPAQWVFGRGLRLPYQLMSSSSRISLHSRVASSRTFRDRIAMLAAAQRAQLGVQYARAISESLDSLSRGPAGGPSMVRYNLGDQVFD